jgi:FkbM family methyltransferase
MNRKQIVAVWNKIMRIKILYPFVIVGRKLIFSEVVNSFVDYIERHTNREYIEAANLFFEENKKRIDENKTSLSDERSRYVYENIIKYRSTLNRNYVRPIREPLKEQYFAPDIIKWKNNKELFIDCGAYIGDTLISLNNTYSSLGGCTALCLEPDKYNAVKCKKNIERIKKKHPNFEGFVIRKGVWSEDATLYFDEGEEYSNKLEIENKGKKLNKVPVTSIDEVVEYYRRKTKDESKVTFIKMDIEGSEPEALIGAINTIRHDRPVLAIAIYHTEEQMISIIEWCRQNLENYKFYVRHYSPAWGETDLYAIPKEY